jgi:hypothetical protein
MNDLQYEQADHTGELAVAELLQYEAFVNNPESYAIFCDVPLGATEKWRQLMKEYISSVKSNKRQPQDPENVSSESDDLEQPFPSPKFRRIPNYVALKRINNTSAPDRVFDEIDFIRRLGYFYNTL